MTPIPQHKVTISASGIANVVALLGETPAQITGGYGGWTVDSRDRRKGLTVWNGKDPIRMQISLLFDGFAGGVSQEVQISRLSRMALPPAAGGEPPTVTVEGAGIPDPGPTTWVIESLNWGTNVLWDFGATGVMSRVRQDCVVNLLEYVAEDRVAFKNLPPGMTKAGKSKAGWPKKHAFIKGQDTLQKLAATYYKNSKLWKKIADANNIRDPKNIKDKTVLRIPAP